MAIFLDDVSSERHYWGLDVPLNYSPPLQGTELTLMFISSHLGTVIARGDIVFCFAHGRLVMTSQVESMASMSSLQFTLAPNMENPASDRCHFTAVRTRVCVRDFSALYLPGNETLIEQLRIAPAVSTGPDDNLFSAVCDFDQKVGKALHAAILHSTPGMTDAKNPEQLVPSDSRKTTRQPMKKRVVPDFLAKRQGMSTMWAISVPHNFRPPKVGETITVFVSSLDPANVIAYDDPILFFSRSRLVMVARAKAMHTPVDLQISFEIKNDPDMYRAHVTTVEAMVVNAHADELHNSGDDELRMALQKRLREMFNQNEMMFGDARPFIFPLESRLSSFLQLDCDEWETASA